MKKLRTIFAYLPILLSVGQLAVDLLYWAAPSFYLANGFYFANIIGQSLFCSMFMLIGTYAFPFCAVSKYAAFSQVVNSLAYLFIQQDNTANVVLQISVLSVGLALSLHFYTNKFPNCSISFVRSFITKVWETKSCSEAMIKFSDERDRILYKQDKRKTNGLRLD